MAGIVEALRRAGVPCDDSALTRELYAHDASNYRIPPALVAFPRTADEVAAVLRICHATNTPVTARGSGTGMAGNTIGSGVILDMRKSMHSLLALDADAATASVQPGLILDDLQRAAAPHGLMFGPDPSSHSRATLGGMVGNDACGNHSVAYGRTSQHVLSLDLVLADGTRATATRNGLFPHEEHDRERVQHIIDRLVATGATYARALEHEFDRCPRQVSGYAAHRLLPGNGFDIARLLVGSEGTLAVVVGITVQLVPRPTSSQLLVLGYRNLIDAAHDVPRLLDEQPAAIEAIDTAIVATMRARRGAESVPVMPEGDAWLYVEFADTVASADLDAVASRVMALGTAVSATPVADAGQRAALWRVREDGAGLASNLLDGRRGRPGWEDAAVPPERLAEYLTQMAHLAEQHGYSGVLYGHFGAGCVHVRFDFDTETPEGRISMRAFLMEAASIVSACGGSVSGEHGDGRARGELLQAMYSRDAISAFIAIKDAFDPTRILNPHIIIDPPPLSGSMPTRRPMPSSAFAFAADDGDIGRAASRCVGVGRCVTSAVSTMCPTYDVTGEEQDSTRGRAHALQGLVSGDLVDVEDALDALDDCLACKACSTDCPTGVDMATLKAEMLHQRYRHRLRPRSHYLLGWLPVLAAPATRMAPLANAVLRTRAAQRMLQVLGGVSPQRALPPISPRRRTTALKTWHRAGAPQAILFIDSTTRSFRIEAAEAALRVLAAAGIATQVVSEGCCGLTWISSGQLDTARRQQRRLLAVFDLQPPDLPIIVLEPSCAATMAHDLPELLDDPRASALARRIRTFGDALRELAPAWEWPVLPEHVVLQTHCHERATFRQSAQGTDLRNHGVTVTEAVGCCGMAGAYGYEEQHRDMSVRVAERSLLPSLDAHPGATVLADGFGCACQISDLRPAAQPLHLAQLLDRALCNAL